MKILLTGKYHHGGCKHEGKTKLIVINEYTNIENK